jgi:hypothetical protein
LLEGMELQASCTKTSSGDAPLMLVKKTLVEKNICAAFLSKRELEQSHHVAMSPKNGRHRSSRRFAGTFASTLERRAIGKAVQ